MLLENKSKTYVGLFEENFRFFYVCHCVFCEMLLENKSKTYVGLFEENFRFFFRLSLCVFQCWNTEESHRVSYTVNVPCSRHSKQTYEQCCFIWVKNQQVFFIFRIGRDGFDGGSRPAGRAAATVGRASNTSLAEASGFGQCSRCNRWTHRLLRWQRSHPPRVT